jgi:hypothetical protein
MIAFIIKYVFGIPDPVPGPLSTAKPMPEPVKRQPPPDGRIKFTERGIPYKDIPTEGHESGAWKILNSGTQKQVDDAGVTAALNKGFASDTVLAVYRLWVEKRTQSEIAAITDLSISTVKKITPFFKIEVQKSSIEPEQH